MKMNKPKSCALTLALGMAVLMPGISAASESWLHEESDLPADPVIQWGQLENGIRYVIMPWQEPPGRVSLRLLVKAGSLHETDRQKGLAHFLEHMAFNGSRNFSPGEMVEYFQRLGMAFGPDTNAHTWWKETVYKLEFPNNDEALLRDGLLLLRDYADGMLLLEDQVEKEKGVILSEARDGRSAQRLAYEDGLKFALPDTLMPNRLPIGDDDVIRLTTREELQNYYSSWYTPDRIVLIAVGEVDPAGMESLFMEYFADMPPRDFEIAEPDLGTIVPAETRINVYSNEELPLGSLEIYTRRKIEPRVPTFATTLEQIKLDLANAMLTRRFEKLSKEEDAPFTRGNGYDYRWLDFVRYSGVFLNFDTKTWKPAMETAVTELNRALEYGFSESELAEAKANLVNRYEEAAARAQTRKSRQLSSDLVRAIMDRTIPMDPATQRDLFVPAIEAIEGDSVWQVFKAAWDQEERLVNLTGNLDAIVLGEFNAARAIAVGALEAEAQEPWAYTDFGEPASVVESEHIEDLDIYRLRLSNGVRLNIKQTDFEANKIHVKASFASGRLEVPLDKPGLELMAAATFTAGGLGEHSLDEIKALTAGRTVGADFAVENQQFTLGGITNEGDLPLQLQLLAAYLSDPGYRPESRRLLIRQLDGLYTQLAHNPQAVLQNEVERFLAGGDERFGYPEREELESRTLEEVAAWLENPLREGYLEVAIVGDFKDRDGVIEQVCKTFGALPARKPERPELTEARQVAFPRGAGRQVFYYRSEIPRAFTTVNWPTADASNNDLARRLSVLGEIFSDRMRVEIREAIGEAYSPYAYNQSSEAFEDFGYLRGLVGVDPEDAVSIEGILMGIGENMAINGIDPDELIRAIEPIKARNEEYRRTNAYWLNGVLLRLQQEPQRLDWARTFSDFWDTVTVEQIEALAAEYLHAVNGVPVHVQPQS